MNAEAKMETAVKAGSYVGAGTSVVSAMTLTEWGVIVGIATAMVTLVVNIWYQARKDRREQREHEIRIERLMRGGRE